MNRTKLCLAAALAALAAGCGEAESALAPSPVATGLSKIDNVVVIYLENHSFDNLYGSYPGAEGLASSAGTALQVDASGAPYEALPPVMDTSVDPPKRDRRFPANLPNAPFDVETYVPADQDVDDLVHRYYQEQQQIDGGKMDKFALVSDAGGLTMGYYDTSKLPLATFAAGYAVCDDFFHSAFGGSFLNHQWLIAAATPRWPGAPSDQVAVLDAAGALVTDGAVTPDGYVVNTAFAAGGPHPDGIPAKELVPPQSGDTIGDRMTDAGVSWAWYAGGWNAAVAGHADALFQYHHQPFVYYAKYGPGTEGRSHLKDEADFLADAKGGTLPAVSFVKPSGQDDEHPGYATLAAGEQHVLDLIAAVMAGPQWKKTAIVVTYDENGGFWDHVPPPKADRWGPGSRVPAIVVSAYAKAAYVDHTKYETASILATIEHRFGLAPLSDRDAKATDLSNCFDFSKSP
ncbi:MAG TPA: alkaline phosphatase family protein [Minicystis sp.]|nr:alkaline phosphatase family protein [Minicystis sp.]